MQHIHITYSDVLHKGRTSHLSRTMLGTTRPKTLHQHDFFELIWVQNGLLRHHSPTGITALPEGSLIFLTPQTPHAVQGKGDTTLIVSIMFHPDLIGDIGRTTPEVMGRFFWQDSDTPVVVQRDIRQMAEINQAAMLLERRDGGALASRGFLLPLLLSLLDDDIALPAGAPDWLGVACAAARDPKVFRNGASGFVAVTGKAHAHVSRTARQFLGQSPSEYINTMRMNHAARLLTGSNDSLAEIAVDCGIPNLSHFHKLFMAHHGLTPANYRKCLQRNAVQPQ